MCQQAQMTRSQARIRMRMAWGWRLPRRRACRYRWAAHWEAWRLLSAKVSRGVAGTGVGCPAELDHGALAGLFGDRRGANLGSGVGKVAGPVQDRADLGQDLGQVDLADARQRLEDRGLGVLGQGGGQGRSRSAMLPSRLRSSRTWMRMQSARTSGSSWSTATGAVRSR